jgi:2-(1,2-epoxy-1,2-dihydrophenyl)acetyl-CoA isomerase
MDDPATLNALTPAMMIQLHDTLLELTRDPKLRIVILTGTDPAFSAGGHLTMISDAARTVHTSVNDPTNPGAGTLEAWRWIRQQFGGVARIISNSNAVFVAAVNGSAAGVGLAFAFACDVIIASEKAQFVPAFGKLGLVPEVGTSFFLTRKLGYQGACNFFIEGKSLSGQEAMRLGICQQCVEHSQLMTAAKTYAANAMKMPAHALEMTKTLLRSVMDMNFESSLRMEEFAEANCFSTRALPFSADRILNKKQSKL